MSTNPEVCKTCGTCPTCDKKAYIPYPYYYPTIPYSQPYWNTAPAYPSTSTLTVTNC